MAEKLAVDALEAIQIFKGLNDKEKEKLLALVKQKSFVQGEAIVREGDVAREMFAISAGKVSVQKKAGVGVTEIAQLGPGDCFGEMALIDIQPRSASVLALEPTIALAMSWDDLVRVYQWDIKTYTLIVLNIARELSERLRRANILLVEFSERAAASGASGS